MPDARPTEGEIARLARAANEAAEELYIALQYSRRPAVRERWEVLTSALLPFREYLDNPR